MSAPLRTPAPRAWMRVVPAVFLMAWGGNHFTPLIHLYEEQGHYSPWQANLLLATYVAGLAPGLLAASAISDKHGRKPVAIAGLLVSALASVLLAIGFHAFALLLIGRAFAGLGVGVAMSVGTSWMKELSSAPFDLHASKAAGARRPSLTLTLGFGLGAGVTGALAQWGPAPWAVPYWVHLLLALLSLGLLVTVPESLPRELRTTEAWWRDLRIPSAGHRRFTRLVAPCAPWIFVAASVAYAVIPAAMNSHLGEFATLYATGLTVLTLGCGAVIQNAVPWINRVTRGRALAVGAVFTAVGLIGAVGAAITGNTWVGAFAAAILGGAFGITIFSGLLLVQSVATRQDLAAMTGLYYALSYTGFLMPTILAALLPVLPYAASLGIVAVIAALFAVTLVFRRPEPLSGTASATA